VTKNFYLPPAFYFGFLVSLVFEGCFLFVFVCLFDVWAAILVMSVMSVRWLRYNVSVNGIGYE
jgi:hypothetical protein